MKVLFKVIIILLIGVGSLYGWHHNKTLFEIQSKIYPKLVLMDKDYKTKLVRTGSQKDDLSIVLTILTTKKDIETAKEFKNLIQKKYNYTLRRTPLKVKILQYENLNNKTKTTSLFLLESDEEDIKKAVEYAKHHSILTFSYNEKNLKHGVMMSLFIGKSVKPYINKSAIKNNNINLDPMLIGISEIYE